MKAVSIDC